MKALARLVIDVVALAVLVMITTASRPAEAGCTGLCLGGANAGAVCATDSACPGGACDETGSSITNVNNCVPGGKGSKDCFLEWSVTPQPPPDKNGFPAAKYECLDNDPSCDADTTPGQCTFLVGACINVTDGRFACTPTSANSYQLKKPSAKDATKPHKNRFDHDNRRNVDLGLGGLGLPTGTGNICTPQRRFVVPLKKGTDKGKGKIGLKMSDPTPSTDSDTLQFTCLPNFPAIATMPCASARQITNADELIGGPLAMGRVGDWLLENDKVRYIIRDAGRDFSFMLTYGGHLMDADFQRKLGLSSLTPPYPPGRDSFLAMAPLINISSTDNPDPLNPNAIQVVNSGATGGPAILRTTGKDDLFDPIDPAVAITGFSDSLAVPPQAIDNNIDVDVMNEYTLECGDDFLRIDTTIENTGASLLKLYVGDFTSGGGQLEIVVPGLGFGESALRLGSSGGALTYNYLGWYGFGESEGVSYGLIPQTYLNTSSFTDSGVAVPVYGQSLVGVLLSGDDGVFVVPAGLMGTFTRWFGVSDNGMGRILDARHKLAARGDITPPVAFGYVQGTVTAGVSNTPIDGARVVILKQPGDRAAQSGVLDVFETKDGGFFQGTLPRGSWVAEVKMGGYPYDGPGGTIPAPQAISVGGGTTIVNFNVPDTGFVHVMAHDNLTNPLAAKVSVVGLDSTPDPGITENATLASVSGNIFGIDMLEKVLSGIYGLPQVHFAGIDGDTGVFAIPPGDYQFVVSHGPEYSVYRQTVTVTAGSPTTPQLVDATVVPVVDTTGFISSDYHVHLINSPDSFVTKNERIITMLAEGVDYFVASDHDFMTDLSADVAALGASNLVKTAVSDEITYFDSGHFGAWPLGPGVPGSVTGGAVDWGREGEPVGFGYPSDGSFDLSPNDMALLAKGAPYNAKVVAAQHFNSRTLGYFRLHGIDTTMAPPQSSTPPANVRQAPTLNLYTDELTALELWIENNRAQNALALGENLGDYFNMLNNFDSTHPKLRKAMTFDSDTHTTTVVQAGGPRNMVASTFDAPSSIDVDEVSDNLNAGRSIGTNGPFMRVTISGSALPDAGHALGKPLIVKATGGSATVHVDIQSPDWAEFDQVQIYVNTVPVQPTPPQPTPAPNFVGGTKKVFTATPTFTLNKGVNFAVTPFLLPNGGTRLTASINKVLTITQDSWVVVIVKGRDGFSKPLFPMAPTSIFPQSCSSDPCRACGPGLPPCGFFGTCTISNQTLAELSDGNLGQCGVTALAIANPLFIDFDGDGKYKGVTLP